MKNYFALKSLKRSIALVALFAVLSNTTLASIWYVDTAADTDPNTCTANEAVSDANCTFRDAVSQLGAGDTIRFLNSTTVVDTTGAATAHTITANNVTIDGATGGFAVNLDGNGSGGGSALSYLKVFGTGFTLNGVHIYNFVGNAVELAGGANGANIHDNVIGLNSAGAGTGNTYGINNGGASGVTIQNNVISNNTGAGIFINSLSSTYTTIKGNRIGVDGFLTAGVLNSAGGTNDTQNNGAGIEVQGGDFTGGTGLTIGGTLASDRNIISGNNGPALWVRNSNAVTGTITVENNYIGLGKDGTTVLANDTGLSTYGAIDVENSAATAADWLIKNNVISGNTGGLDAIPGIAIRSGDAVTIQGNYIGVKADGTTAAGNSGAGILVDAATVLIGTNYDGVTDATEGNIISNNTLDGIDNTGTETTTITIAGNKIGLDSADGADGNGDDGIQIYSSATAVNIGKVAPTVAHGANSIGNNAGAGINILGTGGTVGTPAEVVITNNNVGASVSTNYSNVGSGIKMGGLIGTSNVRIGTNGDGSNDASEGNRVGVNATGGVSATQGEIALVSAVKNLIIAGNYIFGNNPSAGSHGIVINNSLDAILNSVVIGGDDCSTDAHATSNASTERNYLFGLKGEGIYALNMGTADPTTTSLTIQCNQIGIRGDGTNTANALDGIWVADAGATVIKDNTVSNSTEDGVYIGGGASTAGTSLGFYGNKIGTANTGLTPAGNTGYGLVIDTATLAATELTPIPVIIGGATAALGNVFAANAGLSALNIFNVAAANTPVKIQGNYIGVCADPYGKGTIATGNLVTCANAGIGIAVVDGAPTIGGGAGNTIESDGLLGTGNVISNNDEAVRLDVSSTVSISGNIIGLIKSTINDPYNVSAPNDLGSIEVWSGSPTITIGGTSGVNASSNRNVISSNDSSAVLFRSASNPVATIINNYINSDWAGTTRVGNGTGLSLDDGSTITIGGTGTNEGNLIVPSTTDGLGISIGSGVSGTVTILKNILGLDATGTVPFSDSQMLININAADATVNIGNGAAGGRNLLAGSEGYAIMTQAATAVSVLGNYIGVETDGTTSAPNATDSAALIALGYPVAETYFTAISGALTVTGNVFNNSTHVAAYYKDETPTNESTMTADNTWYTKVNATVPTYNFWQRYSGATLAAFGPKACDDGYDNDSDGLIDYSADAGCSSASDTDETDPVVVVSTPGGGALPTPSSTPRTTTTTTTTNTTTTPTTTTDSVVVTDTLEPALTQTERDLRDFVIDQKLNEAVNVATDALLGKNEVNVDLILAPQNEVAAPEVQPEAKPLTPEQVVVVDALDKLAQGEDLTKDQVSKVEATVNQVLENSVQEVFKKAESSGGSIPSITISSANGKSKTLTKDTKIKFVLDFKKSADIQDLADVKGEDTLVVNPSTVIGDNNVSALLIVMQGGEIGDPLAAEKIFFKGLSGLGNGTDQSEVKEKISFAPKMAAAKVQVSARVSKLEDLLPKKPMLTNMFAGVETAPKFLAWVAGPKAGEKVSVFAVDKVDPKNPKSWKVYKFGKHNLDEGYKAAIEVDLSEKMDQDMKKFTLVVQDEKGVGTSTEITLNKNVTMKLDTLTLINGDQVKPIDLTKKNDLLARSAKSLVHVAATKVNSKDKSTDEKKTPEVITVKGYSEPGSVIFVTWKSVVTTSTVIADANGYFEVQVPKQLEKGDHTAYTSSYNKEKKTASNFAKIMFAKFF